MGDRRMTTRTQPTQKRVRELLHYNFADRVDDGPIGNDQFRAILLPMRKGQADPSSPSSQGPSSRAAASQRPAIDFDERL